MTTALKQRARLWLAHPVVPLTARALEDLARSGLTAEDAHARGIVGLPPVFGQPRDDYRIPYHDRHGRKTGFYRDKLFGRAKQKYDQASAPGSHWYLDPTLPWDAVFRDPSHTLIFTEGEKKAMCACKHGFYTIGLGGVWNWKTARQPMPELDEVDWQGRDVVVCYDSDLARKYFIRHARERLTAQLLQRGALVRYAELLDGVAA